MFSILSILNRTEADWSDLQVTQKTPQTYVIIFSLLASLMLWVSMLLHNWGYFQKSPLSSCSKCDEYYFVQLFSQFF